MGVRLGPPAVNLLNTGRRSTEKEESVMDIRRLVTGHDSQGKAVFVSDEAVPPITVSLVPGMEFHRLWGSDSPAHFPDDGASPEAVSYFPPLGGFRFGLFTIPPDQGRGVPEGLDVEAALAEFQERLPGLAEFLEPGEPGMHTTATIDYGIVVSGQATLELDDGVKVALEAGDTYIQNGTRHRWSNTGAVPAVVAIALLGASHDKIG
ncbi:MAG TPA: cupin domain-containing protein [Acidimicrobiales bacterium]|jgi:mannose-6-phosphate isomerase-like protein (cupin superfamily)|nr:cupin domain-containing protein [Acidimicrobiales bacterium]